MARKLNNETTDWIAVEVTSKAMKTAHATYTKAQAAANEARQALEDLKTRELVGKGEIPDGSKPYYSHRFGKWSVAVDKVDGTVLSERTSATGKRGAGKVRDSV